MTLRVPCACLHMCARVLRGNPRGGSWQGRALLQLTPLHGDVDGARGLAAAVQLAQADGELLIAQQHRWPTCGGE